MPKAKSEVAVAAVRRGGVFAPVSGEIVARPTQPLVFGKKTRTSPYDAMLERLAAAGRDKVLKFPNEQARQSIFIRAKKLGMQVAAAVDGGALFIEFQGWEPGSERYKRELRQKLCEMLGTNPRSAIQLATTLRGLSFPHIDATLVDIALKAAENDGLVSFNRSKAVWEIRANPVASAE